MGAGSLRVRPAGDRGYLASRGRGQNRWHSLVKCDHGDATTRRFDSLALTCHAPPPPRFWPPSTRRLRRRRRCRRRRRRRVWPVAAPPLPGKRRRRSRSGGRGRCVLCGGGVLAGIHLCNACSCHENIETAHGAGRGGGAARAAARRPTRAAAPGGCASPSCPASIGSLPRPAASLSPDGVSAHAWAVSGRGVCVS
jgi:hypothetical protein